MPPPDPTIIEAVRSESIALHEYLLARVQGGHVQAVLMATVVMRTLIQILSAETPEQRADDLQTLVLALGNTFGRVTVVSVEDTPGEQVH
jgi:hypothetical protein